MKKRNFFIRQKLFKKKLSNNIISNEIEFKLFKKILRKNRIYEKNLKRISYLINDEIIANLK